MGRWAERAEQLAAGAATCAISVISDNSPPPGPVSGPNVANVTNVKAGFPAACAGDLKRWRAGLAKLDPDCPFGDVAPGRWSDLVAAAVDLFNGWAPQAMGLGWSAADLFGAPGGLAVRLAEGWRVVAITEHRAALRGRYGLTEGWHYRGSPSRSALLWDLER